MKLNRFPKMILLWTAKFTKDGVDPDLALAFGYAAALQFAIVKNRAFGSKKNTTAKHPNIRKENATWQRFECKELPFKVIEYKIQPDGVYIRVAGKVINATKKVQQQITTKFKKGSIFDSYFQVAKAVVDIITNWHRDWYKFWKKIRDLDWEGLEIYQALSNS